MFLFRRSGAIFCTQNVSGSQRSAFLLKWRINAFALNHVCMVHDVSAHRSVCTHLNVLHLNDHAVSELPNFGNELLVQLDEELKIHAAPTSMGRRHRILRSTHKRPGCQCGDRVDSVTPSFSHVVRVGEVSVFGWTRPCARASKGWPVNRSSLLQ